MNQIVVLTCPIPQLSKITQVTQCIISAYTMQCFTHLIIKQEQSPEEVVDVSSQYGQVDYNGTGELHCDWRQDVEKVQANSKTSIEAHYT